MAILVSIVAARAATAQQRLSEAAVKAAYLYRFAGYVEWPPQSVSGHPFFIEVMGDPEVARELRHLLPGHLINGQVVEVKEITRVQEAAGAQILYVGPDHVDFLRALSSSGATATLVVTDEEQGLDLGGVLNFVTVDNRVRFEVSLTAAERVRLKISADLLSVAIRVHGVRRQSEELCVPFPDPQDDETACGIREALRLRQLPRRGEGKLRMATDSKSADYAAAV